MAAAAASRLDLSGRGAGVAAALPLPNCQRHHLQRAADIRDQISTWLLRLRSQIL